MADVTEYDDMFDAIIACSAINLASTAALLSLNSLASKAKRKHRVWISWYLLGRPQYGAYNSLMRDLLELDNKKLIT
jgi:hypothetical protein